MSYKGSLKIPFYIDLNLTAFILPLRSKKKAGIAAINFNRFLLGIAFQKQ